jgi:uncharacterized protein YbjT (DUF2867 family)
MPNCREMAKWHIFLKEKIIMTDSVKQIGQPLILVTGATGYVGGRLIPRLLEKGYRVRVLVRGGVERLNGRSWQNKVEISIGDVLSPTSLTTVLVGVTTAYYLIHSMSGNKEFSQRDITDAQNFSQAAAVRGVKRIVKKELT